MCNLIPSDKVSLIDIWPEDEWCDTYSQKYNLQKDTIEKIDFLVQSWKETASKRNFGCVHLLEFHCFPALSEKIHQLRFVNEEKKLQGFNAKIERLKVSAMVEEFQCPQNTSLSIHIEGVNLETEKKFTFHLSVARFPETGAITYLQ